MTRVGLPGRSVAVEHDGALLDYLPFAEYCNKSRCVYKRSLKGTRWLGILVPGRGNVGTSYEARGSQGDLLAVWMAAPDSEFRTGTAVRRISFWHRKHQNLVQPGEPHKIGIDVSSGITVTEAESLSHTVGAKVSGGKGITGELSASLTRSFSRQVAVSDQITVRSEFPFSARPVRQVVGVYQLVHVFEIDAGPKYEAYVERLNALPVGGGRIEAKLPFTYPEATYLQVSGVDSGDVDVGEPMLSDEELHAMWEDFGVGIDDEA